MCIYQIKCWLKICFRPILFPLGRARLIVSHCLWSFGEPKPIEYCIFYPPDPPGQASHLFLNKLVNFLQYDFRDLALETEFILML